MHVGASSSMKKEKMKFAIRTFINTQKKDDNMKILSTKWQKFNP